MRGRRRCRCRGPEAMRRRHLAGLLLLAIGWKASRGAAPQRAPRRVAVEAKRFEFSPAQIEACVGETLVFEVSSRDFAHGFSLPELGLRIDSVPGQTVELKVELQRAGSFTFLCDNFCGEGHEKMAGHLVV